MLSTKVPRISPDSAEHRLRVWTVVDKLPSLCRCGSEAGGPPRVRTAGERAATKEKGRKMPISRTKRPGRPPQQGCSSSGIQAMQSCRDRSQAGKSPSSGRGDAVPPAALHTHSHTTVNKPGLH